MLGSIFSTVTRLVNAPVKALDNMILDGKTLSKPLDHLADAFDEVDAPAPVQQKAVIKKSTNPVKKKKK